MRLLDDERGQSVQVGAAILLGFVVIAITMYQVEVVSTQNAEVEFEHSQQIQDQMVDLRNGVINVPGGGSSSSQTLSLGTSYPPRTIFLNPSQPRGRLQTTDAGSIWIQNADATGEPSAVESQWDGSAWSRSTRGITYVPTYHEHDGGPKTILEHGHLYNHHPNGVNRSVTDQPLIDGSTITVVSVRGNLSESTSGSIPVRSRAFSTSDNAVSVESTSTDPITITLPTSSPDHWASVLSEERAVDDTSISIDQSTSPSVITFELVPGTYSLQMAEVGVGDARQSSPSERSSYVVPTDRTAPTATVEVRDELNNPVPNAEVSVTVDGSSRGTFSTGSDGAFPIENLDGGETVSIDVVGTAGVGTTFEIESGGSSGGGGAYDVDWTSNAGPYTVLGGSNEVELSIETSPAADGATVEYAVSDSSLIADGETSWQSGTTDASGQDTVTLPIDTSELNNRGGNATLGVFASSGGSGDRLDVRLTQPGGTAPRTELRVEDMSHLNQGSVRFYGSYEVENPGNDYDRTAVRFEGPSSDLSEWSNTTNRRGTASFDRGYGTNEQYTVTVYAIDSNDNVIVSRTISGVQANGRNPAANDALGDSNSPTITDYTILDQSSNQNDVQYQFDWTATSTNFGSVQLDAFSLDPDGGGRARVPGQSPSGTTTLSTYGYSPSAQQQNEFRTQITLFDADGVIVDTANVTDTADGTSP